MTNAIGVIVALLNIKYEEARRMFAERLVYSIFRRAKARNEAEEFHKIYINNCSGRVILAVNYNKKAALNYT